MSGSKLSGEEKRAFKKTITDAFKASARDGLRITLNVLALVEPRDPNFARDLTRRAQKATMQAVEKALRRSKADEVRVGLTIALDIRGFAKQLSPGFAATLDKTVGELVRKAVAKAYKRSYEGGTDLAGKILHLVEKLDASYGVELKKTATATIKPPLLNAGYRQHVLAGLDKIIADAQFLRQEAARLRQAGADPLKAKPLKPLLSFFDRWFGVVDNGLNKQPQEQLDRLDTLLQAVEDKAKNLRSHASGAAYLIYDVSAAAKVIYGAKYEKSLNLTLDQSVGHTVHEAALKKRPAVYLDKRGLPLFRLFGDWIAFARGFKVLGGTPTQPSAKQIGAIVHEWVHVENKGKNINKNYGAQGGHIRLEDLNISRPKKDFPPEHALLNPSTWGAAIAGKEFERT